MREIKLIFGKKGKKRGFSEKRKIFWVFIGFRPPSMVVRRGQNTKAGGDCRSKFGQVEEHGRGFWFLERGWGLKRESKNEKMRENCCFWVYIRALERRVLIVH